MRPIKHNLPQGYAISGLLGAIGLAAALSLFAPTGAKTYGSLAPQMVNKIFSADTDQGQGQVAFLPGGYASFDFPQGTANGRWLVLGNTLCVRTKNADHSLKKCTTIARDAGGHLRLRGGPRLSPIAKAQRV